MSGWHISELIECIWLVATSYRDHSAFCGVTLMQTAMTSLLKSLAQAKYALEQKSQGLPLSFNFLCAYVVLGTNEETLDITMPGT